MKFRFLIASLTFTCIALAGMVSDSHAQHSDIEFGYNSVSNPTSFIIEGDELTGDGIQFFESEFEELDPVGAPGNYFSDEPGFDTNPAEGLFVETGHQIWVNALDASQHSAYGVGHLNFYNPVTDALEADGRISIIDNTAASADLILFGTGIESGDNPQFLGIGDSGQEVHDHLVIDLLDDATALTGAYGILFEIQSDFDGDGTADLTSDPVWIIWNFGLSEEVFEGRALAAFGAEEVPEPSSAILLSVAALALVRRRR